MTELEVFNVIWRVDLVPLFAIHYNVFTASVSKHNVHRPLVLYPIISPTNTSSCMCSILLLYKCPIMIRAFWAWLDHILTCRLAYVHHFVRDSSVRVIVLWSQHVSMILDHVVCQEHTKIIAGWTDTCKFWISKLEKDTERNIYGSPCILRPPTQKKIIVLSCRYSLKGRGPEAPENQ